MRQAKLLTLVTVLGLAVPFVSGPAQAFQYDTKNQLAFTWKNKHGWWFACGPVQCIDSGEKTEEEALGYVIKNADFIGHSGRCLIYQNDREVSGGDYSTDWVMKKARKYC